MRPLPPYYRDYLLLLWVLQSYGKAVYLQSDSSWR
jgi:hypothetical protein